MSETQTLTVKDEVIAMLNTLPKDCTLEDIQYHIYVMEKVKKSLESLEKEGGIPHEQVKENLRKWLAD